MTIPAVVYARKSVEKRDRHSPSIENQIEACQRAAQGKGMEVLGTYQDRGISGAREDRPGLWKAINACPRGGVLITWATDRFSRSLKHALVFLEDHLDPQHIALLCPGDGVDTRTEIGRQQFTWMSLGADMQRKSVARDIRRWYAGRLRDGFAHGPAPFGYIKPNGKLEPDPERVPAVILIFRLAADGWGATRIATELHRRGIRCPKAADGRWRIPTLRDLLSCPTYIGMVGRRLRSDEPTCWQDLFELFEGQHEAIVERSVWQQAQSQIWSRRGRGRGQAGNGKGYGFLLTGLLRCFECGGRMFGTYQYRPAGKRYPRYTCYARRNNERGCIRGQTIGAARVEEGFVRGLDLVVRREVGEFRVTYGAIDESREEREGLVAQLEGLARRQENLLRSLESDELLPEVIERVNRRYVDLRAEGRELEQRLAVLETAPVPPVALRQVFAGYAQLLRSPQVAIETKRSRLGEHLAEVTFDPKTGYRLLLRRSALCAIAEP